MGQALTLTEGKPVQIGIATVMLLVLVFLPLFQSAQAQTVAVFSPDDKFTIPEFHGSISFALNGSYSSAVLMNDTWVFNDLVLNDSRNLGTLKVSAQNSNVTIENYRSSNILGRSQAVNYFAVGEGIQKFNFNLNFSKPTDPSEWMIIVSPTVFLAEGAGWNLLPDDTVAVAGQTGNVTVFHYRLNVPDESGLPFYVQHSVALITVGVVVATVAATAVISYKVRRR